MSLCSFGLIGIHNAEQFLKDLFVFFLETLTKCHGVLLGRDIHGDFHECGTSLQQRAGREIIFGTDLCVVGFDRGGGDDVQMMFGEVGLNLVFGIIGKLLPEKVQRLFSDLSQHIVGGLVRLFGEDHAVLAQLRQCFLYGKIIGVSLLQDEIREDRIGGRLSRFL